MIKNVRKIFHQGPGNLVFLSQVKARWLCRSKRFRALGVRLRAWSMEHIVRSETGETGGRARKERRGSEIRGRRSEDRGQRTDGRISDCGFAI
jgi:hypothetical protein